LSGRGLCDELITRPEESYRLCCVVVCDLETSRMGAPYIYDSLLRVKLFHQGYACLVGYELSSPVDWYGHRFWQICADVTEEYATSFVRVLCCPADDVCTFPLNDSTSALPYFVSHFRTR